MRKSLFIFLSFTIVSFLIQSCEKDEQEISAEIVGFSEEILRGDSATRSLKINGGTPPFAFRYKYLNSENVYLYRNVIDIPSNNYDIKLLPTSDITYEAESVASYGLVGDAVGTAPILVAPVTYRYAESIPTSLAAFMQKSRNELTYTSLLQLRNTNGTSFERTVFFEFDLSQFTEIKDKSRFNLKFWLVGSHSVGIDKPSAMDVKAILGSLDPNLTWDTQPATVDLTSLFSQNFTTTSTDQQIEFEGNIDPIVYAAIANGETKITFVVRELLDDVGSGGYFFVGSDTYSEPEKRPLIDMYNREKL